ncbi:MAG: oligogalacturonate lyase family protein [Christensenellales bacterium]|jgi:oligogalacturonide lyase
MKKRFEREEKWLIDEGTGRRLRQITDHPSIHHHPFFLIPVYDSAMRYLYFVSHRTGSPQVFVEDKADRCFYQLSDVAALNEWSVHPWENLVYYIADGCALCTDAVTGKTEVLLDGGKVAELSGGAINPGTTPITPGTTAVSACGRFWAIRIVDRDGYSIWIYDRQAGVWAKEYTGPMVSHMQFCPDDHSLLFFAGPLTDRVWVLNRKTGQARRTFQRDAAAKQWITHESWIPGRKELSLVDWPKGILAVNVETGAVRRIASFNAWHAIANDQGTRIVADTNFPDRGLMLCDVDAQNAKGGLLCRPQATSLGAHWAEPFPYDDGPIQVYAPQHTHPHPRFSPDGEKVVFTSDKSGFAQLFEVELPQELR